MVEKKNEIINTVIEEEIVEVDSLKDHPRNPWDHPDDQLDHIETSIRENGVYKNVVVAQDSTLLAGHGVVRALRRMGVTEIPVRRLPLDPDDPRALKVLAGDNMISHLAVINDRMLTDVLQEINQLDTTDLMGTGFDEMMLANLAFVTRSEFADFDEAAHWVGMPEYVPNDAHHAPAIVLSFRTEKDRDKFVDEVLGKKCMQTMGENTKWSAWWPPKENEDKRSLLYEG